MEGGTLDVATVLGYGGWIGYAILALSVAAGTLAVGLLGSLRRRRCLPPALGSAVGECLSRGDLEGARQRSEADPSLLAAAVRGGLHALPDGRPEAVARIGEAVERRRAGLLRRIEYLNVIATVAPMLGLLGTVAGMVRTFAALSRTEQPVDPTGLSAGIFQALVTTMIGLGVAIPTILVYTVVRNRADALGAAAAEEGERLLEPVLGPATGGPDADASERRPRAVGKR